MNSTALRICIVFFLLLSAFGMAASAQTLALPPKSSPFGTSSKNTDKYFSFGLGYQYLFWGYDVTRTQLGGTRQVIDESSTYHGLSVDLKFAAFRPFGLFTTVNVYLPFYIAETLHFAKSTTGAGAQYISDGQYVIKNVAPNDALKAVGITTAAGFNYAIPTGNNTLVNVGVGVSWIVFVEDVVRKDRVTRTSSSLGFVFNTDFQINVSPVVGFLFGSRFAYYPIPLFSVNNVIGDFQIQTKSFVEFGANVGMVFNF